MTDSVEPDLVDPQAIAEERDVEASLRPKTLDEFVGQAKVREQLQLVLESAMRRRRPPDHILLSGPPGLGKTSLAMIVAAELGTAIRVTSGPAIDAQISLAPRRSVGSRWRAGSPAISAVSIAGSASAAQAI